MRKKRKRGDAVARSAVMSVEVVVGLEAVDPVGPEAVDPVDLVAVDLVDLVDLVGNQANS